MFVRIVRLTIYSRSCMMHTVFTATKAPFNEEEPKRRVSVLISSALVEKSVCAGTLRGYCHISGVQRIAAADRFGGRSRAYSLLAADSKYAALRAIPLKP